MSRVSEYPEDFIRTYGKLKCVICGKEIDSGGHWHGEGGTVAVCTDTYCIERMLHACVDALLDGQWSDIITGDDLYRRRRKWRQLTDRVLIQKAVHIDRSKRKK